MSILRRFAALLLALSILFSLAINAFALPVGEDSVQEEEVLSFDEYHDSLAIRKQISVMALERNPTIISNDYVQFYVKDSYDQETGRFTIGNTGGNPKYSSDDNRILLFGHPNPWSSYTTIRIDGADYIFLADSNLYDTEAKTAVSTMTINDILITQTLQFVVNQGTGLEDSVKISYTVQNNSGSAHSVGVRIMMDTMLGDNDGAPFKVPSLGNVTTEKELMGNAVPQFWQAFDNLDNPSVFAIGTLYKDGDRKPDRVTFTNWGNVYDSNAKWTYQINPYTTVTGDSAVSVYWNPVSVDSNASTSVSTYYGVGYALSENDSTIGSAQIPTNGFGIQVIGEDRQPISGVSVTAQNLSSPTTVATDDDGIATFSTFPQGDSATISFKLEKEGYQTSVVDRVLTKGGLTAATLYADDGKIKFLSATATINGSSYDLLNDYKYFKENAEDTTAADDQSNVKNLVITVDAFSGTDIAKYQLLQGGEVKVESDSPTITIPVYTGTATDTDKYGSDWRIDKLDAGKVVYLRAIDVNGNASDRKALGLKISKPTVYGMTDNKGTLNFGEKMKLTVPSNIPILGDTEIELGWNGLPFEFEVSEDGKVKFAINPKYENSSGKVNWYNVGKDYDEALLSAVEGRTSAAGRGYGGTPQKFGAGKVEVSADIMGYGEGFIDEDNNLVVNVGIVVTVSQSASYTWTFFLGYVPVYISVGEKVSLSGSGQISILASDGDISVSGAVGELNPQITLNVDGGVGANGVLSIGASGRATLSWLNRWTDGYNRVDLTGGMYIVAKAFLFKAEKKLAEGTWTIYDGYSQSASSSQAASSTLISPSVDFYDADAYKLMDRDYLNAPVPFRAQADTVKYGVYPNATPRLVQVGNRTYLFWLEDIAERASADRSALVYTYSDDNFSSWVDPIAVMEETETSTADYAFDVCVSGSEIHIVLSKANTKFGDEEVTLDQMAAASEIHYLKLDTTTGAVTSMQVTEDAYADTMPAIAVADGQIVLAYVEDRMEEGFFGTSNTQNVVYASVEDTVSMETVAANGLVSGLSVGKLGEQIVVSYVLDTDNDYNTDADAQLWSFDGLFNQQVSGSSNGAASPAFAQMGDRNVLMWYENGNILYSDGSATEAIFGDAIPHTLSRNFYVLNGEQFRVVWETASDDEQRTDTNVYAVSYQNGEWTAPYQMMETGSELTSNLSGYTADGKAYVTYLKTVGVAEESPISSLCVAQVEPDANISLSGLDWEKLAVKAGSELPLRITVQNIGSKDVDTFDVYVDGNYISTITDANLARGQSGTFEVSGFTVPSNLDSPRNFTLQLNCEDDYDNNNSTQFVLGYVDVAVTASTMLVDGHDCANIVVTNSSHIPANVSLRITADDTDGAVLFEQNISGLTADAANTMLVDLTQISGSADIDKYYIQATTSAEDAVLTNNSHMLYRALGKEKTYSLSVTEPAGGSITGDTGGTFVPGEEITLTAAAYPYYRFIGWQSSVDLGIADPTAETITFLMPEADVSIWAEFEDCSIYTYLDTTSRDLEIGATYQPQVSFSKEEEGLEDTLTWTSSNTSIATVDDRGVITAVGVGETTITVTSSNQLVRPASMTVNVHGIYINLNPTYIELEAGSTYRPEITFSKEEEGLEDTLLWTSSDTSVATVDNSGVITAVGKGRADIYINSTSGRIHPNTLNVFVYQPTIHTVTDPAELESPHNYDNESNDIWVYTCPDATSLTLKFNEATQFESGYDKLEIMNGNKEILGTYSGTELANAEITVPGDTVMLRLTSDGSVTRWGFKVDSVTAVFPELTITQQPVSVSVANGKTAKVSVQATGAGLKYQWYVRNTNDTKYVKSSNTTSTYSAKMTASSKDRRVYCVITDRSGNTVQTVTVRLRMAVSITTQPETGYAVSGAKAKVSVKATGDGLKYQWYVRNTNDTKYAKSSNTTSTYSAKITASSKDRRVYCVITDKYGNSVQTKTVRLRMAVSITTQPETGYAVSGSKAKVSVKATGDGLKYQWYVRNANDTKYAKSSNTTSTYSAKITASSKDRRVYCVITDKYGNTVQTKTVRLRMAASITTQPENVSAKVNKKATVTLKAAGDGLKYQWYYANKGSSKFTKASSFTSNTYSVKMTKSIAGRRVYCVVTDKYGKTVKSNVVTLTKK